MMCSDGVSELFESYAASTPAMASVGKTLASPYSAFRAHGL